MATTTVMYIGNCQAQVFESLVTYLGLNVEVIRCPPVWLINKNDEAQVEQDIQRADIVFCQRLAPDFSFAALRPANLRALAPNKAIIWPNMYFDGYFPGIGYLYSESGKIEGPLRDYHFDWMQEAWKMGQSVEATAKVATDPQAWTGRPDVAEASVMQLRERETEVDVKISDFIVNHFRSHKMFFSMNHPSNMLLYEMLRRLSHFAGLPFSAARLASYRYALNQVEMPVLGVFKKRYRPTFEDVKYIKGAAVDPTTGKAADDRLYSSFEELTQEYFRHYDRTFGRTAGR